MFIAYDIKNGIEYAKLYVPPQINRIYRILYKSLRLLAFQTGHIFTRFLSGYGIMSVFVLASIVF